MIMIKFAQHDQSVGLAFAVIKQYLCILTDKIP